MSDLPSSKGEVPVNRLPLNRLALRHLQAAGEPVNPASLYLAQLAQWGLETGVEVRQLAPGEPDQQGVEELVGRLVLEVGAEPAHRALRVLLSNPNLDRAEQQADLERSLEQAPNPLLAAAAVVEQVHDLLASRARPDSRSNR